MKITFVWLSLFVSSGAFACDAGCDPHQSPFAFDKLIQKIAIVGQENRESYPDYARHRSLTDAQMMTKVSGTVEFHCGGEVGGANLVSKNGCLALDLHAFFKRGENRKCMRILNQDELKSCYLNTVDSRGNILGEKHFINPATLKMPSNGNHCEEPNIIGNDWAVIQTRFEIPERLAKPYDIFDVSALGSLENDFANVDYDHTWKVSVVAMGAENFQNVNTPSICDGVVGDVEAQTDSHGNQQIFHTNSCSSGPGSSGSGVTVQKGSNQAPELLGIVTGSKGKDLNGKEYGPENFTGGTLIQGDFLKAITACKNKPLINR